MLDRCHFKDISSAPLRDVPLARAGAGVPLTMAIRKLLHDLKIKSIYYNTVTSSIFGVYFKQVFYY